MLPRHRPSGSYGMKKASDLGLPISLTGTLSPYEIFPSLPSTFRHAHRLQHPNVILQKMITAHCHRFKADWFVHQPKSLPSSLVGAWWFSLWLKCWKRDRTDKNKCKSVSWLPSKFYKKAIEIRVFTIGLVCEKASKLKLLNKVKCVHCWWCVDGIWSASLAYLFLNSRPSWKRKRLQVAGVPSASSHCPEYSRAQMRTF